MGVNWPGPFDPLTTHTHTSTKQLCITACVCRACAVRVQCSRPACDPGVYFLCTDSPAPLQSNSATCCPFKPPLDMVRACCRSYTSHLHQAHNTSQPALQISNRTRVPILDSSISVAPQTPNTHDILLYILECLFLKTCCMATHGHSPCSHMRG